MFLAHLRKKKNKLFSNILGTFHLFLVLLVLIE